MNRLKIFLLISICFVLSNCATYNKQVSTTNIEETYQKNKTLEHRFYLIGDAGNTKKDSVNLTLKRVSKQLESENKNTTVLFLGDNIYPKGLPKKGDKNRELAAYRLKVQTDISQNFKGDVIFVPGNHDWYNDGLEGLKRQQKFVEKQLGKNSFLPKNGCPIKIIDVDENIVIIFVDS